MDLYATVAHHVPPTRGKDIRSRNPTARPSDLTIGLPLKQRLWN
jgi:hypothetical protein